MDFVKQARLELKVAHRKNFLNGLVCQKIHKYFASLTFFCQINKYPLFYTFYLIRINTL